MIKMFIAAVIAVALLAPAQVNAYGVRHVGYTHVGPTGVQHYGATAYRGPYSSGTPRMGQHTELTAAPITPATAQPIIPAMERLATDTPAEPGTVAPIITVTFVEFVHLAGECIPGDVHVAHFLVDVAGLYLITSTRIGVFT